MRIWHLNLTRADLRVDGIAVAIRRLSHAQTEAGAETEVFGGGTAAVEMLRRRLEGPATRPDLVHFHSVFRPLHAGLARQLQRAGVPYVISPHSGYAPPSFARRRLVKWAYASMVERRFVEGAAGASCLTPVEEADVRRFAPGFTGHAFIVPNPVEGRPIARVAAPERPQVVTLCRYDVRQKGLDRLAAIARHLPDVDVAVYGEQDKNERGLTNRLRRSAPRNFRLRSPVFGPAKDNVLGAASLFVLTSRWEGLSMSLAEALGIGVPCAVSRYVGATLPFAEKNFGLVLDDDPAVAASQVSAALADPVALTAWASAGAAYASAHFAPAAVACRSLAGYESVLAASTPDRVEARR